MENKLIVGSPQAMAHEPSLEPPDIPDTDWKAVRYIICRHQEGISLNGYEWVCDDDGEAMQFETPANAVSFLRKQEPDWEVWSLPSPDITIETLADEYGIFIRVLKYDEYGINPYEESANE